MGFLVKFIIFFLIVAIGGGFLINQLPSFKQKVIEVINPAVKEARILGELKENLALLESAIEEAGSAKNQTDVKSKIKNSQGLIAKSKDLLNQVAQANDTSGAGLGGIVRSTVGRIIDALIDKTPFPADHLTPAQQNQNSSQATAAGTCQPTR